MQHQRDILIVDDDAAILEFIVDLLADEGHIVRTEATGSCAIAAVATDLPALMLLDMRLPDMDGADVLRHLRTKRYSGPIVMMSARTEDVAPLLTEGATAYLAKPFDLNELLSCVQQYVAPLQNTA